MSFTRPLALLALLLLVVIFPVHADEEEKQPTPSPDTLPSDAIIVIAESTAKALEMVPKFYLLTAERYRSLQEELARLRPLADPPAAETPSELQLKGKVDGNLAYLTATFGFKVIKANTVVYLGGSPAQATGVSLGDGKTPRLSLGRSAKGREEGFHVTIETPGEYTLTLDLVLPLSPRTNGQGFTLELPRIPAAALTLELPAGSHDVRLAGKAVNGSALKDNRLSVPIGNLDRLELDWKSAQTASTSAVLTAEGAVKVRIEPVENQRQMTTSARLTLSVLSGQTKQWRLVVPPHASLKVEPTDQSRVERIETDAKQKTLRTIHLKEASADSLTVTVTVTEPSPRPNQKPVGIGPFNVLGAVRQHGSVLVSCAVPEWHVEPSPHGDLTRRAATSEELRADPALTAAFRYGPGNGERQSGLAWLDLEVEGVSGQLKARPVYTLALVSVVLDNRPALRWQVRTTLTVTPRRAGIDRFAVTIPADCELDEDSIQLPDRVRNAHYDRSRRVLEFRLDPSDAEAVAPVTVTFESNYPRLEANAPLQTALALPRPLRMFEQEGTIRVQTLKTDYELLIPPPEKTPGLELTGRSTQELTYRYVRRAPSRVEVQWRPYRPVVRVDSLIDLTLTAGQGQVRHQLRYHAPADAPPGALSIRVPEGITELRLHKGGQLTQGTGGTASLLFAAADQPIELEYTFALPTPGRPIEAALVQPTGESQGEARVRVWSDPGLLPLAPADWSEQNLEEVPGRDRLPVLVLRASRHQPLTLLTGKVETGPRVLIERVLVVVTILPKGEQFYEVSYRLGHLTGRHLDFEMPAPAGAIGLSCSLNDKQLDHEVLPSDASGKIGQRVRLRLSARLVRSPGVLKFRYTLTPDRIEQTPVTMTLVPPRPLDEAAPAPARWQINDPTNRVILGPEPGAGASVAWGWRGWLWTPRPQTTAADLKAWFAGTDGSAEDEGSSPSFVAWRDAHEPLRLIQVSRQHWLIGCSLLVAVLGLALTRLALSSQPGRVAAAWVLGGLLAVIALALGVLSPALAAQIAYGCQPGLMVLILLAILQWLLHERTRRREVALPNFSPPTRPDSPSRHTPRPHGEPSTVDAPRNRGSSVERTV